MAYTGESLQHPGLHVSLQATHLLLTITLTH